MSVYRNPQPLHIAKNENDINMQLIVQSELTQNLELRTYIIHDFEKFFRGYTPALLERGGASRGRGKERREGGDGRSEVKGGGPANGYRRGKGMHPHIRGD
jgi:hypothetical protein